MAVQIGKFEFGNGSRMSDEKPIILENLNISRAKNDINKLQQVLEQGRVIEQLLTVFISLR